FDVVFASNLLEHLSYEDFQKTIAEVNRILKKGGKFIIIQPNFKYCAGEYFDDYTHRIVFTHISLCDALMASGFKINVLKPRFLPFTMKSSLSKLANPILIKFYLKSPLKPFAKQMLVIAEKV
ncbi:MAG: class I SAM-dependent methyltransferase, partial [Candidatus Altiarchaeales archaeon]|nr:class I SAM-dependent methyltransferase [Candidatus Altiarchaeales archaeon]